MPEPLRIFISYAHKDAKWLTALRETLAPLIRQGRVDPWADTRIDPGSRWREEIRDALAAADVGVLLVSRAFLASDFIAKNELPPLLAKEKILWVLIDACLWEETEIAQFQAAHPTDRPLETLTSAKRKQALTSIAKKILAVVEHPTSAQSGGAALGPVWNVPYPRNRFFTGREQALEELHNALATGTAALTQTAAIAGLGGVGKTQTAVEYAYRHRNDYRAVLWAGAGSETTLSAAYGEIAALLGLPEAGAQNPDETREAVKRWLAREAGYLLVLDNADEPGIVTKFLPPHLAGRLLITSRSRHLESLSVGEVIALP